MHGHGLGERHNVQDSRQGTQREHPMRSLCMVVCTVHDNLGEATMGWCVLEEEPRAAHRGRLGGVSQRALFPCRCGSSVAPVGLGIAKLNSSFLECRLEDIHDHFYFKYST